MINSLSAANIAFNMSSSKFAWFPSLLSVFSNSFKLRKKCLLLHIVKKCIIKQLLNSVFQPDALENDSDLDFDKS